MEKMLETSLQQLKLEQKKRKEVEGKCLTLNERIKKLEVQLSSNEENFRVTLNEKEEKIIKLEATTEFLQKALIQKDEEIGRKEDIIKKLRSRIEFFNDRTSLDTVNTTEEKLTEQTREGKSEREDEGLLKTRTEAVGISPVVRKEASPHMNISQPVKSEEKTDHENNEEILIEGAAETEESWEEDVDFVTNPDEPLGRNTEDEEVRIKTEPSEEPLKHIRHKTRCKVCQEVFPNKLSLIEHEKTSGHFLKFGCQHCSKRFRQKIQVTRHEAQVHSQEMPYQCNRCDRKFKSEFSWKRHQDNDEIHKKMENYTPFLTCQVCGKQFERRRKWCLDQHMLTHQPSNQFPCDLCGKFFRSNNYLTTHRKACAGVKEEECAFCGKMFSKRTVRLNHERLHTGELPYQCRLCGARFRTHHNYSVHGRQVHGARTASHFNMLQAESDKDKAESSQSDTNT